MDALIFQDQDLVTRINTLERNAENVVDDYYYERLLSEEDVAEEQQKFAETHIEIVRMQNEKAKILLELNQKIKEKVAQADLSLALIKNKRQEVRETVYILADDENNTLATYNQRGELVTSKPMPSSQRQFRMKIPRFSDDEVEVSIQDKEGRRKVI